MYLFFCKAFARDLLESDVDEVVHSESETESDDVNNSDMEVLNSEENKDVQPKNIDAAKGLQTFLHNLNTFNFWATPISQTQK